MKKLFSSKPVEDNSDGYYSESVYVFSYDEDDEAEDFQILSHTEQLAILGFKEEKTPSKGTIHRYIVDADDAYVVVRETIMSW